MITVKIIADSINSYDGTRITTFELEYPRFIHAEIMTHRVFGRNAQSSRAVPVQSTLAVNTDPVRPLVWGKNKAGMSSGEMLEGEDLYLAKGVWDDAAKMAFAYSKELSDIGLHKQWANRVTEPFSRIKVIITATEWDNFFWLRMDADAAQPEIVELATQMFNAYNESVPVQLIAGEWHMPYVNCLYEPNPLTELCTQAFIDSNGYELTLEDALKISASCCAQVSYRRLNDTKEKAIEIYERLFSGPKPHLSPTEHQGRCVFPFAKEVPEWPQGITHMDRKGNYWSGNLKSFIQYRQLLDSK